MDRGWILIGLSPCKRNGYTSLSQSIRVSGRLEEDVFGGLMDGCLEEEDCEQRVICDDCGLDRGGISIWLSSCERIGYASLSHSIRVGGRLEEVVFCGLVYGCPKEENCVRKGIDDDCGLSASPRAGHRDGPFWAGTARSRARLTPLAPRPIGAVPCSPPVVMDRIRTTAIPATVTVAVKAKISLHNNH